MNHQSPKHDRAVKNEEWKGILLAGGAGTRLFPITRVVSKQLLPIYDKPMILLFPVGADAGGAFVIILLISTRMISPGFEPSWRWPSIGLALLLCGAAPPRTGSGFHHRQAIYRNNRVCLVLGDNIFYGHGFQGILKRAVTLKRGGLDFWLLGARFQNAMGW